MTVTCHEILHGGEGPRGRSVEIDVRYGQVWSDCAEEAARHFDDVDDRAELVNGEAPANDHHDGTMRPIEVCRPRGDSLFFRVRCWVVREYDATPTEAPTTER